MNIEKQNLDFLSGEVREILGRTPASATLWVLGITLGLSCFLLLSGFIFKYEEIIVGDLLLTTSIPPDIIASPQNGILTEIKVGEGTMVKKDDLLAVFESDADVKDVLKLEEDLALLNKFEVDAILAFTPDKSLEVGELAPPYEEFISSLEYVPLYESEQIDQDAINALETYNRQIERSNAALQEAIKSARTDIESKEKTKENILDVYTSNPSQTQNSTRLFELEQAKNEIRSEISKYHSEIEKNMELIRNNNTKKYNMLANKSANTQERIFQLRKSLNTLKKALERWKDDHMILAPANGKVSLYANLSLKRRYKKDEPLIAIIPDNTPTTYIGQVKIPIDGSGKVEEGQEVKLKFSRYPFREFGQVKGTVSQTYLIPKEDAYEVEVTLEDGLKTTTGKQIDFHQQMIGTAEIITKEQLFINRLYSKIFE